MSDFPHVYRVAVDAMQDDIRVAWGNGDAAPIRDLLAGIPRWIAGTRATGQSDVPNVLAFVFEYATAALDTLDESRLDRAIEAQDTTAAHAEAWGRAERNREALAAFARDMWDGRF